MNGVLLSIFQRMTSAAIVVLSLQFLVSAQQQVRVVDWQSVLIMGSEARVLEIVEIKVDGKSIPIGKPFMANGDWLNTLTFRVRNISGKIVNLFGFAVAFPEIKANGHTPTLSISYVAGSVMDDANARKPLLPDEEVELKLPEDQLEIMRQISMKLMGPSNLSKVNICPGLITFADGSRIGGISLRRRVSEP